MDIGQVRQIKQIIQDQPVSRLHIGLPLRADPVFVQVVFRVIRDQRFVGQFRVSRPVEQPAVTFRHRISADGGPVRHLFRTRQVSAHAFSVEDQAMIPAFDFITDKPALGQGQVAMRTAIFKGDGRAVLPPVKYDIFVQKNPAEQFSADILGPGGNVPGVFDKHRHSP